MRISLLSHSLRWSLAFVMESHRLKGPEHGFTHMKLQKLLYYMQGYHVAALGQPLFSEAIEAWEHGPVVREVWYEFKKYAADDIPLSIVGDLQLTGQSKPQEPEEAPAITTGAAAIAASENVAPHPKMIAWLKLNWKRRCHQGRIRAATAGDGI